MILSVCYLISLVFMNTTRNMPLVYFKPTRKIFFENFQLSLSANLYTQDNSGFSINIRSNSKSECSICHIRYTFFSEVSITCMIETFNPISEEGVKSKDMEKENFHPTVYTLRTFECK